VAELLEKGWIQTSSSPYGALIPLPKTRALVLPLLSPLPLPLLSANIRKRRFWPTKAPLLALKSAAFGPKKRLFGLKSAACGP